MEWVCFCTIFHLLVCPLGVRLASSGRCPNRSIGKALWRTGSLTRPVDTLLTRRSRSRRRIRAVGSLTRPVDTLLTPRASDIVVDLAVAIIVCVVAYFGVIFGGFAGELGLFADKLSCSTRACKGGVAAISDAIVRLIKFAVAVVIFAVARVCAVGVGCRLDLVDAGGFPTF